MFQKQCGHILSGAKFIYEGQSKSKLIKGTYSGVYISNYEYNISNTHFILLYDTTSVFINVDPTTVEAFIRKRD